MLKERQDKLNKLLPKNGKMLDMGCARGQVSQYIIQEWASYYGVEYNEAMIAECREKWLQVTFCDLNTWKLPFEDDSFDVVYASHVLEHFYIEKQIDILLECSRILKKGGKILFYMPTWYHWSFFDDETHRRWHSHISLSALAKDTGFIVDECRYSLTRKFSDKMQWYFRIPPHPWYLTEVYIVATNDKKKFFSKEY